MASLWDYDDPEDRESAARDYAAADLTVAAKVDRFSHTRGGHQEPPPPPPAWTVTGQQAAPGAPPPGPESREAALRAGYALLRLSEMRKRAIDAGVSTTVRRRRRRRRRRTGCAASKQS